jgi:hypothetical protein
MLKKLGDNEIYVRRRVLINKLKIRKLIKKFLACYEIQMIVTCSPQKPATGHYPE